MVFIQEMIDDLLEDVFSESNCPEMQTMREHEMLLYRRLRAHEAVHGLLRIAVNVVSRFIGINMGLKCE